MNLEEARSAVTKLNAFTVAMCNAKTIEEITHLFVESKDLLIDVYKYNVERLQK